MQRTQSFLCRNADCPELSGKQFRLALASLVAGVLPLLAHSQEVAEEAQAKQETQVKPSWIIAPSAGAELVFTDNVAPGRGPKESDVITKLQPGIRLQANTARLEGNLDYKWQQNLYSQNRGLDNHQQSLRANGKLELVEQWMFLDASGNIAQRPISVFDTQGVGDELYSTNRTETRSYQWSPYIQGQLGGKANYELRYSNAHTTANSGVLASYGGTTSETWSGRLAGATPLTLIGWSLDAASQSVELGSIRKFETNRFAGTLDFRIDPQWRIFVNAGRESDDFSAAQWQRRTTSGYGLEWAPTERSLLAVKQDRRSYGNSHNISFSHRTALTAWKISDSRNVVLPGQQLNQMQVSTAFEMYDKLLTSKYPNPQQRHIATLLALQLDGISPNAMVFGNVISSQAMIQRRQEVSFMLLGANNTVTMSLQRSNNQRTITVGSILAGDDFIQTSDIRQTGLNGIWVHKLSPQSSLTLNALSSRSSGGVSALESKLRSLSLQLSTKLGAHTMATAGLRRTSFDSSGTNSYDEQAITGSLLVTY